MDIMDRAKELIGESKKLDTILKGEKIIVNNAQKAKEIAKQFKEMEDPMLHWDIVGNKLVKPPDKVLQQRENSNMETEQPKTLLDTVAVDNQKTKVVDGEQVLVDDLGETGNTVSPPEEVKTKRGEVFKNNTIEIWNNDGKYGISINKQLHEIPEAIYDLFLRMVENHRQILTELENEIHNNKKLKVGMVQ